MCDYKWLRFENIPHIKYHSEHNFEYCLPSKSPLLKSLPKTEGHPWSQISFEIHSWTYTHQSPLILADRRQWELEYRVKCEIALSSQDFHIDTHTAPTPCPIRMNKLYIQLDINNVLLMLVQLVTIKLPSTYFTGEYNIDHWHLRQCNFCRCWCVCDQYQLEQSLYNPQHPT